MEEVQRFPCRLSYGIEYQVEVTLECPLLESLRHALDRFEADEKRVGIGLMARLTTADGQEIYLGLNSSDEVGCLGRDGNVSEQCREQQWAKGGNVNVLQSDFNWSIPDCPSTIGCAFLMTFSQARRAVEIFTVTGNWTPDLVWSVDRGRGSKE